MKYTVAFTRFGEDFRYPCVHLIIGKKHHIIEVNNPDIIYEKYSGHVSYSLAVCNGRYRCSKICADDIQFSHMIITINETLNKASIVSRYRNETIISNFDIKTNKKRDQFVTMLDALYETITSCIDHAKESFAN